MTHLPKRFLPARTQIADRHKMSFKIVSVFSNFSAPSRHIKKVDSEQAGIRSSLGRRRFAIEVVLAMTARLWADPAWSSALGQAPSGLLTGNMVTCRVSLREHLALTVGTLRMFKKI